MPTDEKGKYFMSQENIPRRYHYDVEYWSKEGEKKQRKRLTDEDLMKVDMMLIKITPDEDPTDVQYQTVWGPMEDWNFIEGILGYDYGEEGSRLAPATTA